MPLVSIRGYAKLRGVGESTVRAAIKRGALKKAITPEKKIDAEIADKEWPFDKSNALVTKVSQKKLLKKAMANARATKLPTDEDFGAEEGKTIDPVADGTSELDELRGGYFKSRATKEDVNAQLLEIKLQKEKGSLVSVDAVTKSWVNIANTIRTKVLGIPSKAKQRILNFTHEHYEVLDQIVREALEDLSDEGKK